MPLVGLVSALSVVSRSRHHNPLVSVVLATGLVTTLGLNDALVLLYISRGSLMVLQEHPKERQGVGYPSIYLYHHREDGRLCTC